MAKFRKQNLINYEDIVKLFYYNYIDGNLYWNFRDINDEYFSNKYALRSINTFNTRYANKKVGCVSENNAHNKYMYCNLRILGKDYNFFVHTLIWILIYKEWANEIDHIDGNGLNNFLYNLQNVTRIQNCRNNRKSKINTSGLAGVRLKKYKSKIAYIAFSYDGILRKQNYLGQFNTIFEAACARISWQNSNNYTQRHGK